MFLSSATSKPQIYIQHIIFFHDALDYYNDNDDDDDDDCYKIFIANHRFRYSLLYSVLRFFATTLLEPYSKSKKATRRCLPANLQNQSKKLYSQFIIILQAFQKKKIYIERVFLTAKEPSRSIPFVITLLTNKKITFSNRFIHYLYQFFSL